MEGYGKAWAKHFYSESPTSLVVPEQKRGHFAVTHLNSPIAPPDFTTTPKVDSILIAVLLRPIAKGLWRHWIDGKPIDVPTVPAFHSSVFDLRADHLVRVTIPFEVVHFNVPLQTINAFADDHDLARLSSVRDTICDDDHAFANLTRLILPFLDDPREKSDLFLDHFGLLLCSRLIEGYGESIKLKELSRGGLAPWQKRRAEELLSNHLEGDLRLERLAKECDLSPGHFARAFKTSYGMSAHRWILDRRIDLAKSLMTHTPLPLPDVAQRTGFSSQSTFTRAFLKHVGVSPGQWRRQVRVPTTRNVSYGPSAGFVPTKIKVDVTSQYTPPALMGT